MPEAVRLVAAHVQLHCSVGDYEPDDPRLDPGDEAAILGGTADRLLARA